MYTVVVPLDGLPYFATEIMVPSQPPRYRDKIIKSLASPLFLGKGEMIIVVNATPKVRMSLFNSFFEQFRCHESDQPTVLLQKSKVWT